MQAERFEDMSPRGRLRILQQDDGDMLVYVIEDPDSQKNGASAGVEFCTSGGKSPKTLAALRSLMLAMAEDNADRPTCHRRGEFGLGVEKSAPAINEMLNLILTGKEMSNDTKHDFACFEDWYEELKSVAGWHDNAPAVRDPDDWICKWEAASPEDTYYDEYPEHKPEV